MAGEIGLSVILPAYMEEENLRQLLPRLQQVLSGLETGSEILVIDTMLSLDNTREVCERYGATHINRRGGNVFGDAVRTGLQAAQGEFVVFMDADGSHPPEFIRNLWKERTHADIVIASRYVEGGATDNPRILIFMSLVVNLIYSVVLGLSCKDVSNSFKLYRRDFLQGVALRCSNFDIVEELLFKIKRAHPKVRILEIPFTFRKRMFGSTKRSLPAFILSFIFTLIRLRFGR